MFYSFWFFWLILYFEILLDSNGSAVKTSRIKSRNIHKTEDYSFGGALEAAVNECSYLTLNSSILDKNQTLQVIKERINSQKASEFFAEREFEKERSKEYYANIEREQRRRILEESGPKWGPGWMTGPPLRNRFKRSPRGHRSFSSTRKKVTYSDHNNCTSRCIFARLEMVNPLGFPQEALITKLLDDKIRDRRIRVSKIRDVSQCFKSLQKGEFPMEAPHDDSCVFSQQLFKCMDLDQKSSWEVRK